MTNKRTLICLRGPFSIYEERMLMEAIVSASGLEIGALNYQADVIIVSANVTPTFIQNAHSKYPQARIVALVSASVKPEYRQACLDAGATVVYDMPRKPEDCLAIMEAIAVVGCCHEIGQIESRELVGLFRAVQHCRKCGAVAVCVDNNQLKWFETMQVLEQYLQKTEGKPVPA